MIKPNSPFLKNIDGEIVKEKADGQSQPQGEDNFFRLGGSKHRGNQVRNAQTQGRDGVDEIKAVNNATNAKRHVKPRQISNRDPDKNQTIQRFAAPG